MTTPEQRREELGSVAAFFSGTATPTPKQTPTARPAVEVPPRAAQTTPAPKRRPPSSGQAPVARAKRVARVYASLPADDAKDVRALAKKRSWSLLAVAAAALEEYSVDLYNAEPTKPQPNPLPGAASIKRHGDTYLPMDVSNAEQARWLEDKLRPYNAHATAHLLGCALSHYLAQPGIRP